MATLHGFKCWKAFESLEITQSMVFFKINSIIFGYSDLVSYLSIIEMHDFRGDLSGVSANIGHRVLSVLRF